jgi:hypothetical protein
MKVTNDLSKNMLPLFDQTHLQQHLKECSVFSIKHLARSTAIVQASEVGAISLLRFPIPLLPKVGVGNYRGS